MKCLLSIFIAAAFLLVTPVYAEESHSHDHAKVGGPKGGRLLEHTEPQAEFFLERDRIATISFYDKDMKPVAAESQTVVVIADKDGSKTKIDFEKKGDALTSKEPLPEGSPNLVVQFKQTADAKPTNFRFVLEEGICGECKRAEYACICEH
ncbi:MAG TPA: hypothetical protein DIS66_00230 [Candidatus Omnitrophica bacterium]|nr:hypothetical protein [Candidatus Omnitrophota bacterium]